MLKARFRTESCQHTGHQAAPFGTDAQRQVARGIRWARGAGPAAAQVSQT